MVEWKGIIDLLQSLLAILRDFLLIIVLIFMIFTGAMALRGLNDFSERLKEIPSVQDSPLPSDKCGGGVC